MSTLKWVIVVLTTSALAVVALSWLLSEPVNPAPPSAVGGQQTKGLATAPVTPTQTREASIGSLPPPAASLPPHAASSASDTAAPPQCHTAANGDLTIDTETLADMDSMVALYHRDEALAKYDAACAQSPKAQRTMRELYLRYLQYTQAVYQTFPPEARQAMPIEQMQTMLLPGLHNLRVQYFGAEQACAMFCGEELWTQRMLAIAADYKQQHPEVSVDEAMRRAQLKTTAEWAAKARSPH